MFSGQTRLEAAAAISALFSGNAKLLASLPICNEDVVLLSHAIDRLLSGSEGWVHSDEAAVRKASLLAVQEILLVRACCST